MLNWRSTNGLAVMGHQVTPGCHHATGHNDSHNKITIDFCNIRGLNSNLDPVHLHLQLSKPDLLFLTETQISPNYDINSLQFPHYHTFTNLKFKGGIVCYFKNSVPISHLMDHSTKHFQFSVFKVSLPHHKKFLFVTYRSPNSPNDSDFFNVLSDKILQLNLLPSDELLLLGDFNIHNNSWLSFSGNTNPAGLECEAFATTHNLTQLIDFPTRIPDNIDHNPHTLDLFLTNLPHLYTIEPLLPICSSDHILLRAQQSPSSGLSTKSPKIKVNTWLFN